MFFDFIINILNYIILGLANIFKAIISILPNSPFVQVDQSNVVAKHLGKLNWVVPIDTMINITILWLGSIVVYYLYQVILRWVKAIE